MQKSASKEDEPIITILTKRGVKILFSVDANLMDGAMGQEEDVVEAVLTCEGDFHDPELNDRIERFRHRLKDLLLTEKQKLHVKKVEPWNSVKVTFTIPRDAAIRLRQLAENGNDVLRQMGVRSVQIQGDNQISLTIAGHNNESTQLVLQTSSAPQTTNSSLDTESDTPCLEEFAATPEPDNDELARKNVVDYLRQGAILKQNSALFDTNLGSGASSVLALATGPGAHQSLNSIASPSGSSTHFRFNNIATTSLHEGSQINSSFPFTKTFRAFHPPVPSAGQSSFTFTTQPGSTCSNRMIEAVVQKSLKSQTNQSYASSNAQGFPYTFNTFSPPCSLKPSTASSISNINPQFLHIPNSASPTSDYVMDLPPPPPYPHKSSSISQLSKPVTSSPLLINLLQTEPMTSGSTNKLMSAGDQSNGPPLKKKRKSKKLKDGDVKPYLLHDVTSGRKISCPPYIRSSGTNNGKDVVTKIEHTISDSAKDLFSVDLGKSRRDSHLFNHSRNDFFSVNLAKSKEDAVVNHTQDSFISGFHSNNKPLFSPGYHAVESHSSNILPTGFYSDSISRSAIETLCDNSRLLDSGENKSFFSDLDPFTMDIAAGKIINPYTGQLEPRESIEDSYDSRIRDHTNSSQGHSFTTQTFAKKAKELKEINNYSVPNFSSKRLDVSVLKTAVSNPISVTTSTASYIHSGGPLQAARGISTQHRDISNVSFREANTLPSNIYAVGNKPWEELMCSSNEEFIFSPRTETSPSLTKVSLAVSSNYQTNFANAPVSLSGPLAGGQLLKHNLNPSPHHHTVTYSYLSRAPHAPLESVIYPHIPVSSPSNHPTRMTKNQHNVTSAAANHLSNFLSVQNSFSGISSTPISFTSQPGSSHFSVGKTNDRLKIDFSHLSSDHPNQAASSDKSGYCIAPKLSSPDLLNSLLDKHMYFQKITQSPCDNSALSEGDENSSHSVFTTDALLDQSVTASLLEHSGVKIESHDSGVGSLSERSDDTPSESGDGEFRSGQMLVETEDIRKMPSQGTVNYKMEPQSNSNTLTVGYMLNSNNCTEQFKLAHFHVNNHVTSKPSSTNSHVFHAQMRSIDKQTGFLDGEPRSSKNKATEGNSHFSTKYTGQLRTIDQSADDMASQFYDNNSTHINTASYT